MIHHLLRHDTPARGAWRCLLLSLALLGFPPVGASQAAPPPWTPLFNGRDLAGWVIKAKPADREQNFWRVENGELVADTLTNKQHDYVWLMTEKEYGDFDLQLKFQAFTNSPGNSGVQLRSRYDDAAFWLDGPQIDINPPGPWRTGMMWDETRGNTRWIYPNLPAGQWVQTNMAPAGLRFYYSHDTPAWNTLEISARGTRIRAFLNGVQITDLDGAGLLDDALHRQRRVGLRGHLALQIHTGDLLYIRFKDLFIREW
ncbi:DUF1080 domain-containing protein [Fontisphaera persica]|uniref:3-keto-disaccharide hydrolase n=1 Tax=Fontisphaera persica TaxID=2974023 RepID=UPI0024BF8E95|nr:DUF1080 domain-containing protein [Fontisphaera persica]WCJ59072.1 DUF1080 domain-containing protein [Fontisphaera persica]